MSAVDDHEERLVLAPLLEPLPEQLRPGLHQELGRRRQPQLPAVAQLQAFVELRRFRFDQGHVAEEAPLAPHGVQTRVEGVVAAGEPDAEGAGQKAQSDHSCAGLRSMRSQLRSLRRHAQLAGLGDGMRSSSDPVSAGSN